MDDIRESLNELRFLSERAIHMLDTGYDRDETIYSLEKCKTPKDLNDTMNKYFSHGFVSDYETGNYKIHKGEHCDFSKYKTVNIDTFMEYRIGVCWDYADFEAWFFKNYFGYKINYRGALKNKELSLYYAQSDCNNDCPNHAWLAYMDNGKVYVFESSWESEQGIKEYESEREMVEDYVRKLQKSVGHKPTDNMVVFKYKPFFLNGNFNLDPQKYMDTIFKTGYCIKSDFKEYPIKIQLDESVLDAITLKGGPHLNLYHGSDKRYKVLKATAYNDGHKLARCSWSVFFWDDKELAKRWAVFTALRQIYNDLRDKSNIPKGMKRPLGQHFKVGLDKFEYKIFIRKEDIGIYKEHAIGKNVYVYDVTLPMHKVGIGNNSFQPEYTYNGSVTPNKIEPIKITEKMIDEYCTLLSDRDYDYKKEHPEVLMKPIRGILNPLFHDNKESMDKWKYVYKKMHKGEIKPGDDLELVFKEYDNEKDLNESVFDAISLKGGPHLTLYHGSSEKLDKIEPISFSVGNSMHGPSWSVFMFDDKRLAFAYAFSTTIQSKFASWFKEQNIPPVTGWIEKDGLLKYRPCNIVDEKHAQTIKDKVRGTKFYVYTLETPIDKNLNMIGTATTLPEYTYAGTPKMVKRDEYTMDDALFDSLFTPLPSDKFKEWVNKKMSKKSLYGPWMKMFVNMNTRGTKRKLVLKHLKLEPGSDLSFLKDIIGKDDYHHDVSKWIEGKNDKLYIFGLAGAGKTTMSNNLAKLMGCNVVHIDEVHHELSKKYGKSWKEAFSREQRIDMIWKEVQKRTGDGRAIIEGAHTIIRKVPDLENQSYIIPGTSAITSTYRMIKRTFSNDPKQGLPAFKKGYEGKSKFSMYKEMLSLIYDLTKSNFTFNKELNRYRTFEETVLGYSDANNIYKSLPEEEKKVAFPNGHYVDSDRLIVRHGMKDRGFADAYTTDSEDIAFIIVATSPDFRGQGIAHKLIADVERDLKQKNYKKIIYRVDKSNLASIHLAKSMGYKQDKETTTQITFHKDI